MHVSRRVVLIGTGSVGSSYAFALVNQKLCNELVLIQIFILRKATIKTAKKQILFVFVQESLRNLDNQD